MLWRRKARTLTDIYKGSEKKRLTLSIYTLFLKERDLIKHLVICVSHPRQRNDSQNYNHKEWAS
jgi:hypothetical protein